jgi:hypothetical protein
MQTALSSGSRADQASIQMNRVEKIHLADIDSVVAEHGLLKRFVNSFGYVLTLLLRLSQCGPQPSWPMEHGAF